MPSTLDWERVDAFLQGYPREGPRLEYRSTYDIKGPDHPLANRQHRRFIDTVGAMANSGGGLIFVGVEDDEHDRPERWPTLRPSTLRAQTLENAVVNFIEPPLALEIGIAKGRSEAGGGLDLGEVLVVKVPDVPDKPVFVDEAGILIRHGQSNVHARLPEIRGWFSAADAAGSAADLAFLGALGNLQGNDPPVLHVACRPTYTWTRRAWGDETDALLQAAVSQLFGDVPAVQIGEERVDFRLEDQRGNAVRWIWAIATGVIVRSVQLLPDDAGRVDLLAVAGEVERTWQLALRSLPVIRPGYPGPIDIGVSIGSIRSGFRTHRIVPYRLEDMRVRPLQGMESWGGTWTAQPQEIASFDLVVDIVARMVRAFGYSNIRPVVADAAAKAVFRDATDGLVGAELLLRD